MVEIAIKQVPRPPKCFGFPDNFYDTGKCNSCSFQHDCTVLAVGRSPTLTIRYTTRGKCLHCGKVGFCLVLQYNDITFRICLPDLMKIEYKAFRWKAEEDDKIALWKPHKGMDAMN